MTPWRTVFGLGSHGGNDEQPIGNVAGIVGGEAGELAGVKAGAKLNTNLNTWDSNAWKDDPLGAVSQDDTAPKNNVEEGKDEIYLVPMDLVLRYVPAAYQEGVVKYKRESWRGGFKVSVLVNAIARHLVCFFWGGEDLDREAVEKYGIRKTHMAAIIFCCLSILWTLEVRRDLDDRPGRLRAWRKNGGVNSAGKDRKKGRDVPEAPRC
ncbi:MAG: DUF5664 domain-containing protein [Desulfobacterales bacterium]|jgi:hypothetical protein|nr:DUF5664 domain-containing protein [Desulfobacterales bacterium]